MLFIYVKTFLIDFQDISETTCVNIFLIFMDANDIDARNAQNFAKWLTAKLHEKNWSMTRLAKAAGVSPQLISAYAGAKSDIKTSKPNLPRTATIEKLAKGLNVPVEEARRAAGLSADSPPEGEGEAVKNPPASPRDVISKDDIYKICLKVAIEIFNALSIPERKRLLKVLIVSYGSPEELGDKAFEIQTGATSVLVPTSKRQDVIPMETKK